MQYGGHGTTELTVGFLAVVKAEAGTAGMDPSVFRPLQARGQASGERTTADEKSTQVDSLLQNRQEKREVDDTALHNERVRDVHASVAKLAILEPDGSQPAKAFIPPMKKRQASKVTVTTTTTVPPVRQVSYRSTSNSLMGVPRLPAWRR